jgi:hypothetical protein
MNDECVHNISTWGKSHSVENLARQPCAPCYQLKEYKCLIDSVYWNKYI